MAALLPGLVFAVYLVVHRELGRVREMLMPLGTLIVLAIVVPWYAALYQQSGWEPIKSFLFGENLARYVDGVGVNADRPGLVVPAGRLQRFVSVVAVPLSGGDVVVPRASRAHALATSAFASGRCCGSGSW